MVTALPQALLAVFGESVWAAKAFVLGVVVMGIALVARVAKEFDIPNPRLVAALTALLPVALVTGASILSEWPYIVASFAFLLALSKLSQTRQWRWAIAAGVLLALASLTRFLGVFLGAAIVVQAVRFARQRGLGGAGQEIVVSLMEAVPWVVWKVRCQSLIATGEAPPGAYDQQGYYLERFTNIEPLTLFSQLESALFSMGKAGEHVTGLELFRWCAAILVGALLVIGVVVRWRCG